MPKTNDGAAESPDSESPSRPVWSGVISFGLVTIPVDLHSMTRPVPWRLKMLGPDGTPLSRRYYCPKDDRLLEPEEIVRGHAGEDGQFVTVTDDELAALAPKAAREIDLEQFVPVAQISRFFIDRSYLMLPGAHGGKAYRLLVEAMAEGDRAGVGRFVMAGHARLLAITSQRGMLLGHVLRYADEVRNPVDLELPTPAAEVDAAKLQAFKRAIEANLAPFDPAWLTDEDGAALLALAHNKAAAGAVIEAPEAPADAHDADVVDLMEVLKRRLLDGVGDRSETMPSKSEAESSAKANPGGGLPLSRAPLERASKAELYRRAQSLDIPNRSRMSKRELIDALLRKP